MSLLGALAGCGDTSPAQGGGDAGSDAGPPLPAFRVLVDSNRDGEVNDQDFATRGAFSASHGAVFLANVDDDDEDHAVDAEDDAVNGEADAADLARIRTAPWPAVPAGASGAVTVEHQGDTLVRLFRRTGEGFERFDPATMQLTEAELRAGVELGIESTDFPTEAWDGTVTVRVAVTQASTALADDQVTLRVAPWVIDNSIHQTEHVYGPIATGVRPAVVFFRDLETATLSDTMLLEGINTLRTEYHPNRLEGPDVWMQDIMEFGWTSMPGPGGRHAMHVVLRSPNRQRPMALFTTNEYLGPDRGYVWKSAPARDNGRTHDVSLDSFGNLELVPPYPGRPMGRLYHGSVTARSSDISLRAFLNAQGVQGPPMLVDTSWLTVGHVDEFMSFIPANTPRGWKLLWASPREGRALLQRYADQGETQANALLFEGMRWYYPEDSPNFGTTYPAQRRLSAVLADADLMAFNQRIQGILDGLREDLQRETGLTDAEIIEMPFLFWDGDGGGAGAYMPGTVNLLRYGSSVVVARPHGPVNADGEDIVELDLIERLRPDGVTVHFAEQWDLLHAALGEVHCGTNAVRVIPERGAWWEGLR
ncbi:MAG: hypothetical protein JNK72_08925 [Myxococcales bacterium]|nr:hypothetical protein [Myxococcales bacterium]